MGKRDDRRRQQAADLADDIRASNVRPNEPPPLLRGDGPRCPARFGPCDFTMKGNDGIRRCWYCGGRKPEATPR